MKRRWNRVSDDTRMLIVIGLILVSVPFAAASLVTAILWALTLI